MAGAAILNVMSASFVWQLGWIAALGIGAVSLAWLLRRGGVPGSAALAGLLIGLLLGPGIAGRLATELFEAHLVGGAQERRDYESAQAAVDGAIAVAGRLNASISMNEYERLVTNAQQAQVEWTEVQNHHQRPVRWFTVGLAVAFALMAARLSRPGKVGAPWSMSAISIGLWSALLTGGMTSVALVWFGYDQFEALVAGAVTGAGSLSLDPRDSRTAREAERDGAAVMLLAARIATFIVGCVLISALLRGSDIADAAIGLVVAAGLVGGIMPEMTWRFVKRGIMSVIFPWLMALAAARIEVFTHFALGSTIVLVILSGDGRWFSALVGAWTVGGRSLPRAMRLVIPSMSAGPMQAALVAAALHTGILPEPIGFALLFGVCYLESSAPFRRAMARAMVKAENEIGQSAADE